MHIKGTLHWSPSTVSFSLGLSPYLARATDFYIYLPMHVRARWKIWLFPIICLKKEQYAFNPVKFSRIVEKKWSLSKMPKCYKGGPLQTGSNAFLTNKKFQMSKILLEGSGHQNFMNPFENGKSSMLILVCMKWFFYLFSTLVVYHSPGIPTE